jgi:hypothetical protein
MDHVRGAIMLTEMFTKLLNRMRDPYGRQERHNEHVEILDRVVERNAILRNLGSYYGFPISGMVVRNEGNGREKRG